MSNILGIGGYTFDAAACLIQNGVLKTALEEERFSRQKHHQGMPFKSIEKCLELNDITMNDVDYISFCYKPAQRILKRIPYRLGKFIKHPVWSYRIIMHEIAFVQNFLRELKMIKGDKTKIIYPGHHLCHAASSYLVSPFDKSAIMTIDQRGEWETTVLSIGEGNKIKTIKAVNYPHSLGIFYAAITHFLGFKPDCDEYKVMGLSAYGKPTYLSKMRSVLYPEAEGSFRINLAYLSYHLSRGFYGAPYWTPKFFEQFGQGRKPDEPITQYHMDIAASAQALLEEIVFHLADYLYKCTGTKNLCIAGGVGMNGVMNGKLYQNSPFEHIYISPASSDNGLCIGGAYAVNCTMLDNARPPHLQRADFGIEYSNQEIRQDIEIAKANYTKTDNPSRSAAELIAKGKIVGWFQGRMEFGARALGFRSILADPTREDMVDTINKYVKHRESFRPFAPSILEEEADKYFNMVADPVPFMTTVVSVKEDAKDILPATTHVNNTARIQTVSDRNNPAYAELLREFKKLKGIPVVLNTSFNIMGEPLVESPRQALRAFFACGLDALVIGPYVIEKSFSQ